MNNKRNLLIMIITLSLILILGSSYAYLVYTKESGNNYVINVGTLEVTFVDSKTEFLNLSNMYPMRDEEGESLTNELVFQVKNTGNVDSYYDVSIEEVSKSPEFKSVIKYIVNKDNEGYKKPKILESDKYIEAGGFLKPNGVVDYHVKVWLAEEADNTYMNKEFKARVVVNGKQNNYATDVIKKKLVKYSVSSKDDFTGGLIAINTDGELYNETDSKQIIREYRYSGANVNNYVTFNDEEWRIIGVFKEGNEEFLKIVKNELIDYNMIPYNFIVNQINYTIKATTEKTTSQYVYWNMREDGNNNGDWGNAGLQYYLNMEEDSNNNKGYMSYLNDDAKNMIRETDYFLGIIHTDADNKYVNYDNTLKSYQHERDISNVEDNGNKGFWNGKIALMYSSDVGYASLSEVWDTININKNEVSKGSWMYNTLINQKARGCVLLNLTEKNGISMYSMNGRVGVSDRILLDGLENSVGSYYNNDYNLRPCLYLKSNVEIIGGDGSKDNAYQLSLD